VSTSLLLLKRQNTLAYNGALLVATPKSFIVEASGKNFACILPSEIWHRQLRGLAVQSSFEMVIFVSLPLSQD